jgi:hypothetical protein
MIKALWTTGGLPDGWDYDLIGASSYIVAAAIDLILKSRAVVQSRDTASDSLILPAIQVACAEYVVSVGTGSSLITILTAVVFGGSS